MMIQIEKKKIIDDELGVSFNFTLMYLPRVTRSVSCYVFYTLIQIDKNHIYTLKEKCM